MTDRFEAFAARIIARAAREPVARASVATGTAGIAYGLFRLAELRDDPDLHELARAWIGRASDVDDEFGVTEPSVHFGRLGIAIARAVIAGAPCRELAELAPGGDLVLGACGAIAATPALVRASAPAIGDAIAAHAWHALAGVRDRGMAHGWPGLAWAMLRWSDATPEGFLDALDRDLDESPRWCAGAAGRVFLWIELHHRFGRDRDLERAFADAAIAFDVESWTPLTSLCCGLAGRSHALWALHAYTGEPSCRERAVQLATLAIERTAADGPLGLYKGAMGVALLAAAIAADREPAMPLFAEDA